MVGATKQFFVETQSNFMVVITEVLGYLLFFWLWQPKVLVEVKKSSVLQKIKLKKNIIIIIIKRTRLYRQEYFFFALTSPSMCSERYLLFSEV